MTKKGKRRNSSVEHRPTKRRKSNDDTSPIYSTRIITWEEQLSLPPRFHEERDVWPALKILEERGSSRKKEYLLEWEAHPRTGEVFEPSWEPAENVGQELKREWKRVLAGSGATHSPVDSLSTTFPHSAAQPNVPYPLTRTQRAANRRVIPDSSAESDGVFIHNSASSRSPASLESLASIASRSASVEIAETQQPQLPASIRVNVPPPPIDKSDWESLRESQFSHYETPNNLSSSLGGGSLSGTLHPASPSPTADSEFLNAPNLLSSSSTAPSLRSRPPARSDRIQGLGRVLDYSTGDQSLVSTADPAHFATALVHQNQITDHQKDIGRQSSSVTPANTIAFARKRPNLVPITTELAGDDNTQPWVFQSQIPPDSQPVGSQHVDSQSERPALSGRCARKTSLLTLSQESALSFVNSNVSVLNNRSSSRPGMAARGTRQSPRLSTVTPHSSTTTSPRIAVRTNSFRAKSGHNPPEHSSPLAASAEFADPDHAFVQQNNSDSSFINNLPSEQKSSNMSTIPPASIVPSAMYVDVGEASLLDSASQESPGFDTSLNTLTMPVQESIEEEAMSSAEDVSSASKASSSQESLHQERSVPRVDGLVMPTYPILGDDEYAIALPAEGKVQAIYNQTIKVKRNSILRFIRRRGSVNTASTSTTKTIERNEMLELIGRLHDTTTHIDLGLPGIPTQYTIPSHEHAAYAEYAGSKFVFLGYLMDYFKRRPELIVIMAKSGATQDLLEEYLYMKNVRVRRHERMYNNSQPEQDASANPRVELISTNPHQIVDIDEKPHLIIAFDASFEAIDPQVKSLKAKSTEPIPIIHLLVTNSSEHVERCLPPSMPSPIRLRLLVRATYQAHMNLGGSPTIFTNASDDLDGRPMDLGDINRAVRKSPNRRLQMVAAVVADAVLSEDFDANWTLSYLPQLQLDDLEDSPSTGSTVSAAPRMSRNRSRTPVVRNAGQSQNRSQTPLSRATTPSIRKRQLEVDPDELAPKRQRMTPVNEHVDKRDNEAGNNREQELHRVIDSLRAELANEKRIREAAEQSRDAAEAKAAAWQKSLADLQHRYEKRTKKSHEQQKASKTLMAFTEANKQRVEKVTADNVNLRSQIAQQKQELEAARMDLKSSGGEVEALEVAREEARNAMHRANTLEKSLESTKRDFEFLRNQYQDASNKAAELGRQVTDYENRVADLIVKASDEKRRLKELNQAESMQQHLAKIQQLEAEKRSIQVLYKKLEEESKLLKRNRGVQTRGSSTAPGSPGQRSRQGSPAPGNLAPPTGSRASVLRHER